MAKKKDTKKEFIVREEEDKKIHVRPMENGEVIETPIEKEKIEVMSLDNKPINNEVVKNEPVNIPDKFVKLPPRKVEHKNTIKVKNGRVYKELGNGYGMYSDDGSVFKL